MIDWLSRRGRIIETKQAFQIVRCLLFADDVALVSVVGESNVDVDDVRAYAEMWRFRVSTKSVTLHFPLAGKPRKRYACIKGKSSPGKKLDKDRSTAPPANPALPIVPQKKYLGLFVGPVMRNNIAQQVQLGLQRWAANFSSFRLLQLRGHNFSPRFVRSVLVPQSWPSLAYASQVWAPFLTKAQRRTISTRLHQYVRGALRMRQRMPIDNTVAGKSSFTYPLSNYIIWVDMAIAPAEYRLQVTVLRYLKRPKCPALQSLIDHSATRKTNLSWINKVIKMVAELSPADKKDVPRPLQADQVDIESLLRSHWWPKLRSKAADRGIIGRTGHPHRDAKTPLPWEGDPARYLSLWSTCQSGVRAVLSFRSNAVFRTCKRCQAANVNAHHWAWECVDQAQRKAIAALLRVSPNESNKCLESIVAAMCNDKTQSEVFFGAFDYIKRAYKAQASDSGAS